MTRAIQRAVRRIIHLIPPEQPLRYACQQKQPILEYTSGIINKLNDMGDMKMKNETINKLRIAVSKIGTDVETPDETRETINTLGQELWSKFIENQIANSCLIAFENTYDLNYHKNASLVAAELRKNCKVPTNLQDIKENFDIILDREKKSRDEKKTTFDDLMETKNNINNAVSPMPNASIVANQEFLEKLAAAESAKIHANTKVNRDLQKLSNELSVFIKLTSDISWLSNLDNLKDMDVNTMKDKSTELLDSSEKILNKLSEELSNERKKLNENYSNLNIDIQRVKLEQLEHLHASQEKYNEALAQGLLALEHMDKVLSTINAKIDPKSKTFIVAGMFITIVCSVMALPVAALANGIRMIANFDSKTSEPTNRHDVGILLLPIIPIVMAIGAVIGMINLMVAASHKIKRIANPNYALKTELMYNIDLLEQKLNSTREENGFDDFIDNYLRYYYDSSFHELRKSEKLSTKLNESKPTLTPEQEQIRKIYDNFKRLFEIRKNEIERTIDDMRYSRLTEVNSRTFNIVNKKLELLEYDFNQFLRDFAPDKYQVQPTKYVDNIEKKYKNIILSLKNGSVELDRPFNREVQKNTSENEAPELIESLETQINNIINNRPKS